MQIIDCTPAVATAIAYDREQAHYLVLSDYKQSGDSRTYTASPPITNPIEAWRSYWELTDILMRRRIGNAIEQLGRNRYTGEEIKEK